MDNFTAEFIGTYILLLLGNGVVANVILKDTKGNDSGWMVITAGWGLAVFVAVLITGQFSGAHLNPAVTFGLYSAGKFELSDMATYLSAQALGAFLGAVTVWLMYKDHMDRTDETDTKLAVFCTAPAIKNTINNFFSEVIGTFVLVFAVLYLADPEILSSDLAGTKMGLGSIGALPVGLIVFSIGLSLGGTTGYAINPARDLMPRIAHAVLPIKNKRDSDWGYSWIPVLGPLVGGIIAGLLFVGIGNL